MSDTPADMPAEPNADTPVTPDTQDGDWRAALPEELRDEPSLGGIGDVTALAKSYVHAQRMVGADKLAVPGKHAQADEWQAVFDRLGRPETPAGYALPEAEGQAVDGELLDAFRAQAHEAGLLPAQVSALYDWYLGVSGQAGELAQRGQAREVEAAEAKLRRDWGGDYEAKLGQARAALRRFGDDELVNMLEGSGLGNEPRLLAAFARIGAALSEDGLAGEGGGLRSATQAQAEIAKIQGDPAHAYFHRDHPRHEAAVNEVYELFQQAWPEG